MSPLLSVPQYPLYFVNRYKGDKRCFAADTTRIAANIMSVADDTMHNVVIMACDEIKNYLLNNHFYSVLDFPDGILHF